VPNEEHVRAFTMSEEHALIYDVSVSEAEKALVWYNQELARFGPAKAQRAWENYLTCTNECSMVAISAGLDECLATIRSIDGGEQIVVYCPFLDCFLDKLSERLNWAGITHTRLTGQLTASLRTRSLGVWGSAAPPRVMLLSDAGAEGITLVSSCHMIVAGFRPWNAQKLDQAIARIDRNGQTKPVHVYFIEAEGTIQAMTRNEQLPLVRAKAAKYAGDCTAGAAPESAAAEAGTADVVADKPAAGGKMGALALCVGTCWRASQTGKIYAEQLGKNQQDTTLKLDAEAMAAMTDPEFSKLVEIRRGGRFKVGLLVRFVCGMQSVLVRVTAVSTKKYRSVITVPDDIMAKALPGGADVARQRYLDNKKWRCQGNVQYFEFERVSSSLNANTPEAAAQTEGEQVEALLELSPGPLHVSGGQWQDESPLSGGGAGAKLADKSEGEDEDESNYTTPKGKGAAKPSVTAQRNDLRKRRRDLEARLADIEREERKIEALASPPKKQKTPENDDDASDL
jgi:hypothetical protein